MYTYEVITPQTNLTFVMGALKYGQEVKLKTALMATDRGLTNLLNKTIYESIVEKPEQIQTYEDFINKLTIEDRSALIMGLYHNSYGEEYITENECPKCGHINSNIVRLSKYSKVSFFKDSAEKFLSMRKELAFDDFEFKITLQPALLANELKIVDLTKTLELTPAQTSILLHTESVEFKGKKLVVDNNYLDILAALDVLIPKQVREIKKTIENTFEKYKLEVTYKVKCTKCQHEFKRTLDFVGEFFKQVIEA